MRPQSATIFVLMVALGSCAEQGPKPPSVTELTAMLQGDDPKAQREAAHWVVHLGPKAADTAPALSAALKSPDMTVRQSAALALGRIGPGAAATVVPALTAALDDPEISVRRSAAESLGQLGPAARSAIPALEKLSVQSKQADPQAPACDPAADALKKIR